ncbi:AIM24 family protein [Streptacidiphilus sp. N1-3]|uniref:AIM24 family protein n=1 Tax=Streptacidiphilus alkalitolerans TaxID=3342712 RepID=A0ABV6WWH5_9ACTN
MQSALLHHTAATGADVFTLQNDHMLRVALDGHREVLARSGSMVAFQGRATFTEVGRDEQEVRQLLQQQTPRQYVGPGQYQGHGQFSGQARMQQHAAGAQGLLMSCTGTGTVFLANLAQHLHVLTLQQGERLTLSSAYLLAMEHSVRWRTVNIEGGERIAGVGNWCLELTGPGQVVLMTSGRPLALPVGPQQYASADADAVVAWSSALDVQLQSQSSNTQALRRHGTATEGWELSFQGTGQVVIQPSELPSPKV